MADRVIQRNDTAARWQSINPVLATGEIGIEIDGAKGYKIGDGKTRWNDLPYPANPTNVVQELGNNENAVPSQKLVTEKLSELGSKVGEWLYFGSKKKPSFTMNEDGSVLVKLPSDSFIRIYGYDGAFVKEHIDYTEREYTLSEISRLVLDKTTNEIQIVDYNVKSENSFLLMTNNRGEVTGLLAPYYYEYLQNSNNSKMTMIQADINEKTAWAYFGSSKRPTFALTEDEKLIVSLPDSILRIYGENGVILYDDISFDEKVYSLTNRQSLWLNKSTLQLGVVGFESGRLNHLRLLSNNNGEVTGLLAPYYYLELMEKINEGINGVKELFKYKIDGMLVTTTNRKYVTYEDGVMHDGASSVPIQTYYWFKNDGFTFIKVNADWNAADKAVIALFNEEFNPEEIADGEVVESYMKDSSVCSIAKNNISYEAEIPKECKMIAVAHRYNSQLRIPSIELEVSIADNGEKTYLKTINLQEQINKTNKDVEDIRILTRKGLTERVELTSNTSFSIPYDENTNPVLITARSRYTGEQPTIKFYAGTYTSIPFDIGAKELSVQQWKMPPMLDGMTFRIDISIPKGSTLYLDALNYCKTIIPRSNGVGVRFNSHLGLLHYAPEQTMASFESAAMLGYDGIIVNPIKTSDNVWMLYHDKKAYLSTDGTLNTVVSLTTAEFNSKTKDEILSYDVVTKYNMIQYFSPCKVPTLEDFLKLCSINGIRPVFSIHGDGVPTSDEWGVIKDMLTRYSLLHKLSVKASSVSVLLSAYEVLGDIDEYIVVDYSSTEEGINTESDIVVQSELMNTKTKIAFEIANINLCTKSIISNVRGKGLLVVAESYRENTATGASIKELISYGVNEFTDDVMPCDGLNW